MPAASLTVLQSASGAPKSQARVCAVFGTCSSTTTPAVYQFDSDTTVTSEVGYGPGPQLTMAMCRETGQRVIFVPTAGGVAATTSAVTETPAGTGPAVTASGTPNDDLNFAIKIVKAGPRGTAKFRCSVDDGVTYGPTLLTAATYAVPNTGITANFATGTDYVLDTVYTFQTRAAAPTPAELDAALTVALNNGVAFSTCVVAQTDLSAVDTLAMATQLKTSLASALDNKKFLRAILSADVTETDADIVTNFGAIDAERVVLCAGDAYLSNGGTVKGSVRRPAAWAAAIKWSRDRLSSDLGNGADGPLSYVNDWTRDEYSATVKLRDERCTVLETRPGSTGVWFSRGVSLASPGSVYQDANMGRLIDEACRIAQPLLNAEVNNDPPLKANGTISDDAADRIESVIGGALDQGLIRPADGVPHASGIRVTVDRTRNMAVTEDLLVTIEVQKKGQQKTVAATMGISSTLPTAA